jgi:hypothetical protein
MMNVLLSTVPGLPDLNLYVDESTKVESLIDDIHSKLPRSVVKSTFITLKNGKPLRNDMTVKSYGEDFVLLRLNVCFCGGKGGLGSMLRAQGGRMSRKKGPKREEDNDSFKNLDGRTLKSIRRAKELVAYLDKAPEKQRKALEQKRAKLQAIIDSANRPSASTSKFDDNDFLEQSEELMKDVRDAVERSSTESPPSESLLSTSASSVSSTSSKGKEPVRSRPVHTKAANFFGDEDDSSEEE